MQTIFEIINALWEPFLGNVHIFQEGTPYYVELFLEILLISTGFSLLFGEVMHMGIEGYWLGGAIAGNVIGVVCFFYYLSGRWKKRRLVV